MSLVRLLLLVVAVGAVPGCSCTSPPPATPEPSQEPDPVQIFEPDAEPACALGGQECSLDGAPCCNGGRCLDASPASPGTCESDGDVDIVVPVVVTEDVGGPAATVAAGVLAPTLCDISEDIFSVHCVQCHHEAAALNLLPEAMATGLVGVRSPNHVDALYVVANQPDNSLLLRKLTGSLEAHEGQAMPPGTPLAEDQIQDVRAWIESGATTSCVDERELGATCGHDTDCASGMCRDQVCAERNICVELDASCFSDVDCCTGFCSISFDSYGPGACIPLLDDGEYCTWNTQCAGGGCDENLCTSSCAETGTECGWFGIPCCGETVCHDLGPYVPGECGMPFENGEYCLDDAHCLSDVCVDYACATRPTDAVCDEDRNCATGHCSGGICADNE